MSIRNLDDPLARSYLDGTRFDENVTFEYAFETPLRNRTEILTELAAGRRILHIGCCDHVPLLSEKMAAGAWLHGKLTGVAAHCIGIDIDGEAVGRARSLSGLDNMFFGDVAAAEKIEQIGNDTFDYALLGEVIEHIGDPVRFLRSFLANYRANVRQVIITAPNALRGGNIKNVLKARETINSDHRFFFTPYTLAKVAWDAGLSVLSVRMAHYSPAGRLKRAVLNRFPLLAEDIIYIGALRNGAELPGSQTQSRPQSAVA